MVDEDSVDDHRRAGRWSGVGARLSCQNGPGDAAEIAAVEELGEGALAPADESGGAQRRRQDAEEAVGRTACHRLVGDGSQGLEAAPDDLPGFGRKTVEKIAFVVLPPTTHDEGVIGEQQPVESFVHREELDPLGEADAREQFGHQPSGAAISDVVDPDIELEAVLAPENVRAAANYVVLLQDQGAHSVGREVGSGGEAGEARTDDHRVRAFSVHLSSLSTGQRMYNVDITPLSYRT